MILARILTSSKFGFANMPKIITQEKSGGSKPRRQRLSPGGSKTDLRAEINSLQAQLREKEELFQARESALRQLEESLTAKIHELENQIRQKEALLVSREAELKALKSEMDALLDETAQIRSASDRISSETERLTSELKEMKLVLAKVEIEEWRSIGGRNSLKRQLGKLGKLFKKKAGDEEEDRNPSERLPLTSR